MVTLNFHSKRIKNDQKNKIVCCIKLIRSVTSWLVQSSLTIRRHVMREDVSRKLTGVTYAVPYSCIFSYWYVWKFGQGGLHSWPQTEDEMKDRQNLGYGMWHDARKFARKQLSNFGLRFSLSLLPSFSLPRCKDSQETRFFFTSAPIGWSFY